MNRIGTAIGLLLAFIAAPAFAQLENPEGFYLGGGVGDFSTDVDGIGEVDEVVGFDTDDNATRLFGGWRFNNFVSVQLDYTDFGDSRTATQELDATANTTGFSPVVIGTLPLGPVELFAKAGVIFYDLEVDTPNDKLIDTSGEDVVLGAGIGGTVLERLNLRAEYERIDIDELDDADAVWLTASWRF